MNSSKFTVAVVLVLGILASNFANAQQFSLRGKIVDLETYEPLPGVSVTLAETNLGASSNENGEFSIEIPQTKAEYALVSTLVGYQPDSTSFKYNDNGENFVVVSLVSQSSTLEEVVITRRRERISEIALLEERKASNLMLEKIGAHELSRKGVSDAEGALTKMSGVTKSASGANVFVRGLGDRYNSSTLNGLALPSEDPLNKNISLDFFGTDIIQSIAVNKTLNPTILGDVAGANIDINSKELTENAFIEVGVSTGLNTQTIGADNFTRVSGTSWGGGLKESSYSVSDLSKYNFRNGWDGHNAKNLINSSFNLSGGKKFRVGNGHLDLFLTGNMNSEYRYMDGFIKQTTTAGAIFQDQEMTKSQYNVSKTALANLKYSFGNNNYITFNSLFINDQNQEFGDYYGMNTPEETGDMRLFRRSDVTDNKLYVNQLLSKLELNKNWKLDLGASYNVVNGNEPDRRTTNLLERNNVFTVLDNSNGGDNERYYSELSDKIWSVRGIVSYLIGNENNYERKIDFGYNGNFTDRQFDATIFWHNMAGRDYKLEDINAIDAVFNQTNLDQGVFGLQTGRQTLLDPYWYKGEKQVNSMLGSVTYQFNDKLTAIVGLRYDKVKQDVTWDTNIGSSKVEGPSKIDKDYFLPSLNLTYRVNENNNLRLAASQSYTLPQFIEIAPFRNTFASFKSQGRKDLVPVENINVDLKWELFPSADELIAVGAFYKRLKNPIARSEINAGGNTMTYFNVGSTAQVQGVELEIKKNILTTVTGNGENTLSVGVNMSYLHSKQDLKSSIAQFTETESELQGASPFLGNADVTYSLNGNNWNWMSTLVFNYFSDRIYTIGSNNYQNIIEKGVPTLDFVSTVKLNSKWGVNLKARNILNPAFELHRESNQGENIILESYKRGTDMSVGLSYKF